MLAPGTILGDRYEIIDHIGSGGMADVYKAKCHVLNRYVAVKVLREEYNEDEKAVEKFITEAQSTADLQNPNIVNIYDARHSDYLHYIVMELAEGITLKRYIKRYGRLSTREAVDFSLQIANGLQAAHNQNIVHRDIKPQNILVSNSGKIKVADFGNAKVASANTKGISAFGSVHYFSPEQARGGIADERSDIYSLGITMYEMATGRVPFDADNSVSIALKHLHEEIRPPRELYADIPSSLDNIILKCTQKRPDQRYQTIEELIADLKRVFDSPDGEFVKIQPMLDDSPTNVRSDREIALVRDIHKRTINGDKERISRKNQPVSEIYSRKDRKDSEYDKYIGRQSRIKGFLIGSAIILSVVFVIVAGSYLANLFRDDSKPTPVATEASTEKTKDKNKEKGDIEVPNVVSMTKDEAEKMLKGFELVPVFKYEKGVDKNDEKLIVKKQSIEEKEKVAKDTEITLTLGSITNPDGMVEVPSLADLSENEAKETLAQVGLKAKITYEKSENVTNGNVISQSPQAGSSIKNGSEVNVTIATSGEMVEVPSLIGLSSDMARETLESCGLKLGAVTKGHSNNVSEGEIMDMSESIGSMVPENTRVSIQVSMGMKTENINRASIHLEESPFDIGEEGSLEMILRQGDVEVAIYYDANADASQFPLDYSFDTITSGEGYVDVYANGEIYTTVEINASSGSETESGADTMQQTEETVEE